MWRRTRRPSLDWDPSCLFPGAAGPLGPPHSPSEGIRTDSKGSEKPSRKEHLPGQLPNFQGGVVAVWGVLGSLEPRARAGGGGKPALSRLEGAWTVLFL